MKIKIKDINGNWVWYDTETKLTTPAEVLQGTIRNNAVKSVGADTSTKKGRVMAAHNQAQSYNQRLHKVHNYADQTTRLKLKQLAVSVDKLGEPIINQTDYISNVEAPMIPYTPLEELYIGTKALDLPFKIGTRAATYGLAKYGSLAGLDAALSWARNKILSGVFDRLSLKLAIPLTTTLLYLTLKFTPITPNEEGALTFFLRKPSKITKAERLGIPKGERNLPFKEKQLTEHVQGDEAVKMFKEYGGESIPEGSINGELLRKYVAEARERYGLIGNNNITDEEIALALYKHSKELGGNTAAINALGEPLLLFRGDTQRYTQLKKRISPEELAKKSGTMDNSLGNLFLGEFPYSYRGVDRYIGTWRNFNGSPKLVGSGTGSKVVWDGKTASEIEGYPYLGPLAGGGYKLYSQPHRYGNVDVYKLPASMMESEVNDLNAFIVRTPQMRNASSEISVLNDDWMLQGAKDSHFMSKNYKYNPKTYSMENVKTGESLGKVTIESAPESRIAMGDHYKELLKEAKQKQEGLLKSEANSPLRDEHSLYSYFVLPNFNIQGAKHLLPYDLRIPRNWKDKNIYRGLIPLTAGYTLYNSFNQPQLQLEK